MSDSGRDPLNLYLINNVEAIVFFIALKKVEVRKSLNTETTIKINNL